LLTNSETQSFPDNLPPLWRELLKDEVEKGYFKNLTSFLKTEYKAGKKIYPPRPKILRALQLVDYSDVKVVILGQDPYHGDGQATGLSFAVPDQLQPKPPSLINIFKEIEADIGFHWNRKDSELTGWAKQGVLLLNAVLSVRRSQAFSHQNQGWEIFTDTIIQKLNQREHGMIFLLWGSAAQKKACLVTNRQHFILKCAHPSPLSAHRGFIGCKHFSRANRILQEDLHVEPIDWTRIDA